MKSGVELIADEQKRLSRQCGWTPEYDLKHYFKDRAEAAESYLGSWTEPDQDAVKYKILPSPTWNWPWAKKLWQPSHNPVLNLVKAGALIAAEIDRLQRQGVK